MNNGQHGNEETREADYTGNAVTTSVVTLIGDFSQNGFLITNDHGPVGILFPVRPLNPINTSSSQQPLPLENNLSHEPGLDEYTKISECSICAMFRNESEVPDGSGLHGYNGNLFPTEQRTRGVELLVKDLESASETLDLVTEYIMEETLRTMTCQICNYSCFGDNKKLMDHFREHYISKDS